MTKELILEKQKQAVEILKEKDIDMWMTFVRETGNIKDPMLDMIVGTGATWHSAFIITKEGETVAVIGSLEKANIINKELLNSNIDAIIDDTDENFSSKIKKMNLIGAPYQIIIGKKSEGDLLEFKETGGETQNLPLNKIIEIITKQKNSI